MRRIEGKEETTRGQEGDGCECSETHDNTQVKTHVKTYPTCTTIISPGGWIHRVMLHPIKSQATLLFDSVRVDD